MLRRLLSLIACCLALSGCGQAEADYWSARPTGDAELRALLERARLIDVCALLGAGDLAEAGFGETPVPAGLDICGIITDDPAVGVVWQVTTANGPLEPQEDAVATTIDGAPAVVRETTPEPGGPRRCETTVQLGAVLELDLDLASRNAESCAPATRLAAAAAAGWRAEPRRASTPFANTDPCAATAALGVRPSAARLWECGFEYQGQRFLLTLGEVGEQELGAVRFEIDGHPVHCEEHEGGPFVNPLHVPIGPPLPATRFDEETGPRRAALSLSTIQFEGPAEIVTDVLRAAVPLAAG
ncbi:hypothetical protein [Nocardia asteroides]|uniref:hypothetical protein n=1 Tax=Nocardia asteroides TaxID=1824 RepID=UPI001E57CA9F|nr:hypothetical protein [Nocardia asteroides]UGT63856.1 hypothetical protein LTT61_11355 [Nocardia asteroides]